jgi:prepilin-type N-terminal cleavage/methylation domain-containing protein
MQRGFSLLELLVAASIFLLLSGIALNLSRTATERDELNAAAIGLVSWLEVVQKDAQRGIVGCRVTFSPGTKSSGSELANVEALDSPSTTSCQSKSNDPFRVGSEISSNPLTLEIIPENTPTSFVFTPRGTVSFVKDMIVTLRISDASLTRCVRISGTSGMVTIGAKKNDQKKCTDASFRNPF